MIYHIFTISQNAIDHTNYFAVSNDLANLLSSFYFCPFSDDSLSVCNLSGFTDECFPSSQSFSKFISTGLCADGTTKVV